MVEYGAPPERIYNVMVNPDILPDLETDVVRWLPDELPPTVGTLNRLKLKVFGLPTFIEFVSRYTEVDPPRRFALEGVRPVFVKMRWSIDLEELPGRGTRSTMALELNPPWWAVPLARVGLVAIHRGVRKGTSELLQRVGPPR